MHGTLDGVVPFEHGRDVFEAAAGPKQFHPVLGAGHSTIMLGREAWFVRQVEALAEMGKR